MDRLTDYEILKKRLVEMMSKGVEVDSGIYRKMDPIDYYALTNIEPRNLYKTLKRFVNFTPHERSVIIAYAAKIESTSPRLPKDKFLLRVYSEKLIIKGIEVSDEIKNEAINFMEENSIPYTYMNYNAYIRRIIEQMAIDSKRD